MSNPAIRAAEMLTAYAEFIKIHGASAVAQWHYVPEIEQLIEDLRAASGVIEAAANMPADRIDRIADLVVKGMPEGLRGFQRTWGWRQFARALLDVCATSNATAEA